MEQEIAAHLKKTFAPNAILLHGSRARGKEREHSDWDIIFLYSKQVEGKNGRMLYKEQNIELSSHTLPINDVEKEFGTKLLDARVLYEEGLIASDLLLRANEYYKKGVHFTEEKLQNHQLWMEGRIDGMRDTVHEPIIFFKYFADVHQRVANYWYWILQHSHAQPIYIAVEEMKEKDPEYHQLFAQLIDTRTHLEQKVAVAEKIKERLFPEDK